MFEDLNKISKFIWTNSCNLHATWKKWINEKVKLPKTEYQVQIVIVKFKTSLVTCGYMWNKNLKRDTERVKEIQKRKSSKSVGFTFSPSRVSVFTTATWIPAVVEWSALYRLNTEVEIGLSASPAGAPVLIDVPVAAAVIAPTPGGGMLAVATATHTVMGPGVLRVGNGGIGVV